MNKIKVNPSSYYLSLILLIGGMMVGFSQEKTIEGNITDENGLPLPGATVIEQGTNNGTTTDFDGNYQISTQEGNILSGNAEEAYKKGIKASLNYWGITDTAKVEAYIESQPYNASNWKKSIGYQKWVSLYMNGLEAWAEWRRLDQPELKVPKDALVDQIPTKLPYPISEISNNSEQLNKVTSSPTKITDKVWWDVN